MRSAIGWREVCAGAIFLMTFAGSPGTTHATPQVVGDGACERYAVDIASFATCENGRVVRPEEAAGATAPRQVTAPAALPPPNAAPAALPKPRSKATRTSTAKRG